MNSCEERRCPYWNGQYCTDEEEYIDSINGEPCCRFHSNAILNESSQYKNGLIEIDCMYPCKWQDKGKCKNDENKKLYTYGEYSQEGYPLFVCVHLKDDQEKRKRGIKL